MLGLIAACFGLTFALAHDASWLAAIVYGLFLGSMTTLVAALRSPSAAFLRVAAAMYLLNYQSEMYVYIDHGFPGLVPVSRESVLSAIAVVTVFLVCAFGGANAINRWLETRLPTQPKAIAGRHVVGAVVLLAITTAFGAKYGTLTNYGLEAPTIEGGAVRPDLYYSTTLLVTWVAVIEAYIVKKIDIRLASLLAIVVFVLLFGFQMRRLVIAAIFFAVFRLAPLFFAMQRKKRDLRAVAVVLVGVGALGGAFLGSSLWRHVFFEGRGDTMVERMGSLEDVDATELVRSTGKQVRSRLIDLWSDAAAIEYLPKLESREAAPAVWGQVGHTMPGILYPEKYQLPYWTCETAFEKLGLYDDQACPATAEALLVDGYRGVGIAALVWLLWLALCTLAWARGGPVVRLAVVGAWEAVFNLDNSVALPLTVGLRSALMVFVCLALVSGALSLIKKGRSLRLGGVPNGQYN